MPAPEALAIYARFFRIGLQAFGGPFSQIASLQQELVVKEKWTTNARFNRVLAVYQALPGPEATEMCVWLGMCRGRRLGGLAAGLGFLTPGTLLVLLAAFLYTRFGGLSPLVAAAMAGGQAAALALLFNAVYTLGRRACTDSTLTFIAVATAAATLCNVHFGIIFLFLATLGGYLTDRGKNWLGFGLIGAMAFFSFMIFIWKVLSSPEDAAAIITATGANAGHGTAIEASLSGIKAGLLSFGGAYSAVPFLQYDSVVQNNWMTQQQFLDGVAIVTAFPTPLISLSGFVGFVGGGWVGALIMLAMAFLPAFAFTLVLHSRIERLVDNEPFHAALDGAAAGVVGLVAATAVLLVKPTLIDGPVVAGAATTAVNPHWPIKVALCVAVLLIVLRWRPRWINPAVVLAAAAVGAAFIR